MTCALGETQVTVREARADYFAKNHFGSDGGYQAAWVHFQLGFLPLSIPNTVARRRAVPYHDLHHLVTGYQTDHVGEFEISAWEVGAGCEDFWAAWFINLGGVAGGLLTAPRRTFRAFLRGRRSHTLYGLDIGELLDAPLAEVRARVERPARETGRLVDCGLFALAVAAGLVAGTMMLVGGAASVPLLLALGVAHGAD